MRQLPHLVRVAQRILKARVGAGLTVGQLANLAWVSESLVVCWESGQVGPSDAMRRVLADVLHLPADTFAETDRPEQRQC